MVKARCSDLLLQEGIGRGLDTMYSISFVMTEEFTTLFRTMEHSQKRWIDNYSDVVDCLYFALDTGVVAREDAMRVERDVVIG